MSDFTHMEAHKIAGVVKEKLNNFFSFLLRGEKVEGDAAAVTVGRFSYGQDIYTVNLVLQREKK